MKSNSRPEQYGQAYSWDDGEQACPLLALCDSLAQSCSLAESDQADRVLEDVDLRRKIREKLEMTVAQQAALFDLVGEVAHLRDFGYYRSSLVEVARLIVCTGGDVTSLTEN